MPLPGKLRQASYDGDAELIVQYRQRAVVLPDHLYARDVKLKRLTLMSLDLRIADGEDKIPALHEAIAPLQAVADKANEALRESRGRFAFQRADINSLKYDRGQVNLTSTSTT
jgi:hypothetical protein